MCWQAHWTRLSNIQAKFCTKEPPTPIKLEATLVNELTCACQVHQKYHTPKMRSWRKHIFQLDKTSLGFSKQNDDYCRFNQELCGRKTHHVDHYLLSHNDLENRAETVTWNDMASDLPSCLRVHCALKFQKPIIPVFMPRNSACCCGQFTNLTMRETN